MLTARHSVGWLVGLAVLTLISYGHIVVLATVLATLAG